MKLFTGILAFVAFFIPLTGIGVLLAFGLWEGGKNPDGYPVLAIMVGIACACAGVFVGRHSARATMRRYEQQRDSHNAA